MAAGTITIAIAVAVAPFPPRLLLVEDAAFCRTRNRNMACRFRTGSFSRHACFCRQEVMQPLLHMSDETPFVSVSKAVLGMQGS